MEKLLLFMFVSDLCLFRICYLLFPCYVPRASSLPLALSNHAFHSFCLGLPCPANGKKTYSLTPTVIALWYLAIFIRGGGKQGGCGCTALYFPCFVYSRRHGFLSLRICLFVRMLGMAAVVVYGHVCMLVLVLGFCFSIRLHAVACVGHVVS